MIDPPKIPTLYFDDADTHDGWTRGGDFFKTLADNKNRADKKLHVAITQATFSKLPRMIAFAFSQIPAPAPTLPPFDPAKSKKLYGDFMVYLGNINDVLSGTPVSLARPDPVLLGVLRDFDKNASSVTRANLLRLLGVLADDVFIGPHTFHLDISNSCNTNCIFCGLHSPMLIDPSKKILGRRFTEGWKGRKVDEQIFTDLVDDLAAIGTTEDILFSGEGEPMTHPQAEMMVRYVKSKNLGLTLFTNGLNMNEKKAAAFVDAGLDILYWSLSAATAPTFTRLQPARQASDFKRVVDVMSRLVKLKRKSQNKPYIILAHVINNINYDECELIMDLARELGVDSVRYQVMHSCSSTQPLLINKKQFDIAQKQVDRAKSAAEKAGIEVVANIEFQLNAAAKTFDLPDTVLPCHWSHDLYAKTGCLAGWFFSRSFTDGRISFCCHDKIVGNLYRGRFKDLWFSDKYRTIRRKAKAFNIADNPDLSDESCGGLLLDKDCDYCGNYEFINQGLKDLAALGWDKALKRF